MMISFNVRDSKFNFRVSAIIIDSAGKRFLTNTRKNIDFCVLPGGRVEMGEDSEAALRREIREELGVEIDVVGIKATTENFFEFEGKKYHELQYVYIAKLQDSSLEDYTEEFQGVEKKDVYEWKSLSDIANLNYKPAHLKEIIVDVAMGHNSLRHIIHKGNG